MTDASDHPVSSGRRRFFKRRAARLEQDTELAVDIDLDFSECVEGIRTALAGFVSFARKAGMDAAVPTAPEWNVRELIAHQGMVHRWSTAHVNGVEVDSEALRTEGLEAEDPVLWLRDGGLRLIKALQDAPEDLEAPVFLRNAPDPRHFWARRQCHETTIHSVDAQSAALGRIPRAADTEVTREVSLDGIDELLRGFHTRKRSGLRSDSPIGLAIRPTDVDQVLARRGQQRAGGRPPGQPRACRPGDRGSGRGALPRPVEPHRRDHRQGLRLLATHGHGDLVLR